MAGFDGQSMARCVSAHWKTVLRKAVACIGRRWLPTGHGRGVSMSGIEQERHGCGQSETGDGFASAWGRRENAETATKP